MPNVLAGNEHGDSGADGAFSRYQSSFSLDEGDMAYPDACDIGDRIEWARRIAAHHDAEIPRPLSGLTGEMA
jgi:hypothetical protein